MTTMTRRKGVRILRGLKILEVSGVDAAASPGARIVLRKRLGEQEQVKMKTRKVVEIAKRCIASGTEIPFTADDLYTAMQKRANKTIDGPTAAVRFARYCETPDGRVMLEAQKRAAPAPAAPAPATAYDRLAAERQQHVAKAASARADQARSIDAAIAETARSIMAQYPGRFDLAAAEREARKMPHIRRMLSARSVYGPLMAAG
jgi:hypothetical protein